MSSKHHALTVVVILAVLMLSGAAGAAIGMSDGTGEFVRPAVFFGAFVLGGAVVAVVNRGFKRR